jgi:hypothetical protein
MHAFVCIHVVHRNVAPHDSMLTRDTIRYSPVQALKLFREMEEEGIKPDSFAYDAVIGACAAGWQHEAAVRDKLYSLSLSHTHTHTHKEQRSFHEMSERNSSVVVHDILLVI